MMVAGLAHEAQAHPGSGTTCRRTYQPKFPGDPARSESEAQALGYMRVVLRAQREYKKRHDKYAETLEALAGTGSFTKRMAHTTDRGDYTASFRTAQRRFRAHHDAQATGHRTPLVLCGRRWGHSRGRSEGGGSGFAEDQVS